MGAEVRLRAKARDAARAAADGHDAAFGTRTSGDVTKRITEAILTLILPELDARVRAAREEALTQVEHFLAERAASSGDRANGADEGSSNHWRLCGQAQAFGLAQNLVRALAEDARGEHRETEGE